MGSPDRNRAIERWQASARREVLLPSGTRAQVIVPPPETLARDPRVPERLRAMVLRFSVSTLDPTGMTEEEMATMLELQAHLAARTLRGLWDEEAGAFVPVTLEATDIDTLDLPSEDLSALEGIGLRRVTPNQVTAHSKRDLNLVSPAEAKQVDDEEAGGTVEAYAPFRGQPGGGGARPNGADVRVTPEHDAGDRGPGGSVGV